MLADQILLSSSGDGAGKGAGPTASAAGLLGPPGRLSSSHMGSGKWVNPLCTRDCPSFLPQPRPGTQPLARAGQDNAACSVPGSLHPAGKACTLPAPCQRSQHPAAHPAQELTPLGACEHHLSSSPGSSQPALQQRGGREGGPEPGRGLQTCPDVEREKPLSILSPGELRTKDIPFSHAFPFPQHPSLCHHPCQI